MLLNTPLDALHRELGAKMVAFAGYDMPVQYPMGIIKEHLHTRSAAGMFDVSHMGQVLLEGAGSAAMLESLVPVDIEGLAIGRQTYALFTNESGGVLDDLIITRWADEQFFLVVNECVEAADDIVSNARHASAGIYQDRNLCLFLVHLDILIFHPDPVVSVRQPPLPRLIIYSPVNTPSTAEHPVGQKPKMAIICWTSRCG